MSDQEREDGKNRRRPDAAQRFDDALRERALALVAELMDLLEGRGPPPPLCGPQLRLLRGGGRPIRRILKRG
jgi:hypothetical protein